MKVLGFNSNDDKFICEFSRKEMEDILGRSLYYDNEINEIIGRELNDFALIFKENKSAINDLIYQRMSIIKAMEEIEKDLNKLTFILPDVTKAKNEE